MDAGFSVAAGIVDALYRKCYTAVILEKGEKKNDDIYERALSLISH